MDDYDNSPGWEQYEQMLDERWHTEMGLIAEKTDSQNGNQPIDDEVKRDGTYCA